MPKTVAVSPALGPAATGAGADRVRALEALVRARFTPPAPGARRVGLEWEVLPLRATGAPVPPHDGPDGPGTLGVLQRLGAECGWREEDAGYGLPRFVLPDGGLLSYEPGGQLEWSSAVHATLGALDAALAEVAGRVGDAMAAAGIHLLARGVDPRTPLDEAAMVMDGERYRRQRAHYDRRGAAGRAMMLQTAGLHLNLDPGDEPVAAWGVANAVAPLLVAVFANSPARGGATTAARSHRAAIWRALDPTRTAVFASSADPAAGYLAFALGAESFLLGEAGETPRPFAEWLAAGAGDDTLAAHLTTLFPEVRPRGYLELRSVDTLPAHLAVLPAAVAWASLHHAPLRAAILRELPPPTVDCLARAGTLGLADAELRDEACWLAARVPDALRAESPGEEALARRLEEFFDAFTMRARDPGDA